MAKKEIFRLTEGDVKRIAESTVRRILKEGSVETSDSASWNDIQEMVGAEQMLQMLWNYLDTDQIQDFLSYAKSELDMDDDYDEWEDPKQKDADAMWDENDEEMYGYDEDDSDVWAEDAWDDDDDENENENDINYEDGEPSSEDNINSDEDDEDDWIEMDDDGW